MMCGPMAPTTSFTDPQLGISGFNILWVLMKTSDLHKCIYMCIPTDQLCSQQPYPCHDILSLIHEQYIASYWNNKPFVKLNRKFQKKNSGKSVKDHHLSVVNNSRTRLFVFLIARIRLMLGIHASVRSSIRSDKIIHMVRSKNRSRLKQVTNLNWCVS